MASEPNNFVRRTPHGDTRDRLVCADCGHIAYENPKIVTGAVVAHAGRLLLCRRAIAPGQGKWTIPAGYMELGETVAEGAIREAREEACADIAIDGLLACFSISRIGQVQLFHRATFADPHAARLHAAGDETLETALFGWDEIPWSQLAFPTVRWVLHAWRAAGTGPIGAPATNPAEDARGQQPLP